MERQPGWFYPTNLLKHRTDPPQKTPFYQPSVYWPLAEGLSKIPAHADLLFEISASTFTVTPLALRQQESVSALPSCTIGTNSPQRNLFVCKGRLLFCRKALWSKQPRGPQGPGFWSRQGARWPSLGAAAGSHFRACRWAACSAEGRDGVPEPPRACALLTHRASHRHTFCEESPVHAQL